MSKEAIKTVWDNSRDAKSKTAGSPGIDSQSAGAFAKSIDVSVHRLRREIQRSEFSFQRLRGAPVEKTTGGYRIIAVPTVRDRLIQRCLLAHLERDPKFPKMSSISYGFSKGRTLKDAQLRILELRNSYPWILQVDIIKFFDNIQRRDVKRLVKRHVKSKVVAALLGKAVDCEIDERLTRIAIIARENGIKRGVGLRQGMPVAPMLSNLLLRDFDQSLIRQNIPAVRYADDIALFTHSKNDCRDILNLVNEQLSKVKLSVAGLEDKKKSISSGPTDTVSILGVDVKYGGSEYYLAAPFKKLARIGDEMSRIASVDECLRAKCNLSTLTRLMDSFIIGHHASLSVIQDRDEFMHRLKAMKEKCLREFLVDLLGANAVSRLDDSRKAILGISEFN